MKRTPIILLTKDNPEYLYATLKSLTATDMKNNPLVIVDDCSSLEKTKDLLYSDNEIEIKFDDWTIKDNLNSQEYADKEAATSYLNIPQMTKIHGIRKQFTIIKTPRYLGQAYRILYGINLAFTLYNSDRCVILEDDILFNRDWLRKLQEIDNYEFFKSKVGMISVYSEKLKDKDAPLYFKTDEIKGKAVMFSRDFYNAMKRLGLFSTIDLAGKGTVYDRLQHLAERLGFVCLTSKDNYIQNLQKRNIVNKDKILKYDKNFVMPIAWNEDF